MTAAGKLQEGMSAVRTEPTDPRSVDLCVVRSAAGPCYLESVQPLKMIIIAELVLVDDGEAVLLDAEDLVHLDAGEPVLLDADLVFGLV